jgi:hypothetical protein
MYKIPTMHNFASLTAKSGDLIQHSNRPGNKYSSVTNPWLESKRYSNREEEISTGRNGRLENFE